MTFLSYAQNLEDVMLWRALKDVEHGFYIDVGANDPVIDSVTKAFYERGWRGINIEPMEQYYQKLCHQRTEDVNLPVAAGAEAGFLKYFEIPDTGLSTCDQEIAEYHRQAGWPVVTKTILAIPLSIVCRQYAGDPIHFLKIDVEGAEKQVLLGMDFVGYRPWIVIVEATLPNSQEQCYAGWEYILLGSNYHFVYFDGLNRFYVADEKKHDLEYYFWTPPNYFDSYRKYGEQLLETTLVAQNQRLLEENKDLLKQQEAWEEEKNDLLKQNELLTGAKKDLLEQNQNLLRKKKYLVMKNHILMDEKKSLTSQKQVFDQEKINLTNQVHMLLQEKDELARQNNLRAQELQFIYQGLSWRITAPLRKSKQFLIAFCRLVKVLNLKIKFKETLFHKLKFLKKQPVINKLAESARMRFPLQWERAAARLKTSTMLKDEFVSESFGSSSGQIAEMLLHEIACRRKKEVKKS